VTAAIALVAVAVTGHAPRGGRVPVRLTGQPGARPRAPRTGGVFHVSIRVPDLVEADDHHHLGLNAWAGRWAPPPALRTVGLDQIAIEAPGLSPRVVPDAATGVRVRCTAR
jgi:catechol-2,3-dioxygenase